MRFHVYVMKGDSFRQFLRIFNQVEISSNKVKTSRKHTPRDQLTLALCPSQQPAPVHQGARLVPESIKDCLLLLNCTFHNLRRKQDN